jgi:hypothetical protein
MAVANAVRLRRSIDQIPALGRRGMHPSQKATVRLALSFICAFTMSLLSGCSAFTASPSTSTGSLPAFVGISEFGGFWKSVEAHASNTIFTSVEITAPGSWDELVVSWNAVTPPGTGLKIEARPLYANGRAEFFTLGLWASDNAQHPRESVNGQQNEFGRVETDTLILSESAPRLQLRITVSETEPSAVELKFVGLSFVNSREPLKSRRPLKSAWDKTLPVPQRSQLSHADGREWCSPTSVSMVLAYWADRLRRPELDIPFPKVAAGVFDPKWTGTGNWPFNTAFAGQFTGMRAYVTRLRDVPELETLTRSGIPPILSVSFDLLHGKEQDQGGGHLVVCTGFTKEGDVWINDPWTKVDRGESVHRVVRRDNLVKAWARSRQTVYLIYPADKKLPKMPSITGQISVNQRR